MSTPQDDFTPLTSPDHWLGWLGDDPAKAVRDAIESILQQQVATSSLQWIRIHPDPHFLTGGRRDPDDAGKVIVVRAALAVAFTLAVGDGEGQVHELTGCFSWVAGGLDADARVDRTHFDLDMDLAAAGEALQERIYALDGEQA
ncbi:MAG: hypothetical protein K0V04_34225 [Deltaproteobacteria bacterium]|nr:hypothetical protein [Deltaproteobacteria bacterium]